METVRIIGKNLLSSGVLTFAFCEISVHASGRNNLKILVSASSLYKNSMPILNVLFLAPNCCIGGIIVRLSFESQNSLDKRQLDFP